MGHAEDVALCEKHRTLVASVCYCECVSYPCACKLTVARVAEDCAAMRAERDAYRAALAELLPKCACGCFAAVRTEDGRRWCMRCSASVTGTGRSLHGPATYAALALLAGHDTKTGGK